MMFVWVCGQSESSSQKVVPLIEMCKIVQGWCYCVDGSNHTRQKASSLVLWVSAALS